MSAGAAPVAGLAGALRPAPDELEYLFTDVGAPPPTGRNLIRPRARRLVTTYHHPLAGALTRDVQQFFVDTRTGCWSPTPSNPAPRTRCLLQRSANRPPRVPALGGDRSSA